MSVAVTKLKWRNFSAFAPDLIFTTKKNTFLEVDLKNIRMQGANPPFEKIRMGSEFDLTGIYETSPDYKALREEKIQRGWIHNFVLIEPPANGHVYPPIFGGNFRYLPANNFVGQDCLIYALNNGHQNSNFGKILINVEEAQSIKINVFKNDSGLYRFSGELIPNPLPSGYDLVTFRWKQMYPVLSTHTGRPEIHIEFNEFYSPHVEFDANQSPRYIVFDNGYMTNFVPLVWHDPEMKGFIPGTNVAYEIPEHPYPVILEAILNQGTNFDSDGNFIGWNKTDIIATDIRSSNGEDWYDNGRVIKL